MKIEIDDSVRQAGLEQPVDGAAKQLTKVVPRSLHPLVVATWSVLGNTAGKRWVMVALNYDMRVTELAVFEPESLADADFIRERLARLWSGVLSTRMQQRLDEPVAFIEDAVAPAAGG